MQWDEVEREFFIIGVQLSRLSQSFQALARALQREREGATGGVMRRVRVVRETEKAVVPDPQGTLSFPSEVF